ncbi:helix-turn-helix transcriptional regulator [Bacillus sp. AFS029533]|uniref:helix-turn-helix domain-containing protein n=1 Tax=Bacillus sp. AFS029533 TaxID=2033494 RepID=UPI000BFDA16B|nr:helix-turn-helix transcriptional regulator [Bacillus sp. AFS029533]PGZ92975.1 hypothetical protein COE53_08960 [Bacillus sp. AFS029533]
MFEREIIKYYRKEKGFSQDELCEGICSKSHLSRIESGRVSLSSKILALLSERLGIDINEKLNSYHMIENYLEELKNALIMHNSNKVDEIIQKLEQIPFISSSQYVVRNLLILARYYLWKNNLKQSLKIINSVERKYSENLSEYEKNFLLHIKAIYYLSIYRSTTSVDLRAAVGILNQINLKEYKNKEVYYHFALAYHYAGENLLVYINAKKALHYFNATHNYVQSINAQILILIQYEKEQEMSFVKIVEKYKDLIWNCDSVGASNQKAILLNNLGISYFKRGDFENAAHYIERSLQLTDKTSVYYLRRYYNYTETCLEGRLLPKDELLELTNEGIKLAEKNNSSIHITLFKLLKLCCENNQIQYYQYLNDIAIPHFKLTNNISYYNQYGKKLYKHLIANKQYKKAIELECEFRSL